MVFDGFLEGGGVVVGWEGEEEVLKRRRRGGKGGSVVGRDGEGVPDVDLAAVAVHVLEDGDVGADYAEAGGGDEGFVVEGEGVCGGGGGIGGVGREAVPDLVEDLV